MQLVLIIYARYSSKNFTYNYFVNHYNNLCKRVVHQDHINSGNKYMLKIYTLNKFKVYFSLTLQASKGVLGLCVAFLLWVIQKTKLLLFSFVALPGPRSHCHLLLATEGKRDYRQRTHIVKVLARSDTPYCHSFFTGKNQCQSNSWMQKKYCLRQDGSQKKMFSLLLIYTFFYSLTSL